MPRAITFPGSRAADSRHPIHTHGRAPQPYLGAALATIPSVNIWDDHDIVGECGAEREGGRRGEWGLTPNQPHQETEALQGEAAAHSWVSGGCRHLIAADGQECEATMRIRCL